MCLQIDPEKRISAGAALRHPFISEPCVDWDYGGYRRPDKARSIWLPFLCVCSVEEIHHAIRINPAGLLSRGRVAFVIARDLNVSCHVVQDKLSLTKLRLKCVTNTNVAFFFLNNIITELQWATSSLWSVLLQSTHVPKKFKKMFFGKINSNTVVAFYSCPWYPMSSQRSQ